MVVHSSSPLRVPNYICLERRSDGYEKRVAAEEAALPRDGGVAREEIPRSEQDESTDQDQPAACAVQNVGTSTVSASCTLVVFVKPRKLDKYSSEVWQTKYSQEL